MTGSRPMLHVCHHALLCPLQQAVLIANPHILASLLPKYVLCGYSQAL